MVIEPSHIIILMPAGGGAVPGVSHFAIWTWSRTSMCGSTWRCGARLYGRMPGLGLEILHQPDIESKYILYSMSQNIK